MRVALAQINTHICNFEKNFEKHVQFIKNARDKHCDLVVFPEMSLFGYWPADLLERKYLIDIQLKFLAKLRSQIPKGMAVLVGAITKNKAKTGKLFFNSAVLLQKGKKDVIFSKELLPNYDIYDEARHFARGDLSKGFFKFKGKKIFVTVCEDIWAWEANYIGARHTKNPFLALKKQKPDLIVNLSASPFNVGKDKARKNVAAQTARTLKAPIVYVYVAGAQDEIIFDGGSFVLDAKGKLLSQSVFCQEDINIYDFDKKIGGSRPKETEIELLRKALVLGIRDYVEKNGFKKIHLGSSGGIDSAVVACLACDAVGSGRVTTIALPGPFSSQDSFDLALKLAENLKCTFLNVDINAMYKACVDEFETSLGIREFGLTHENLQSRLRGLTLMAVSNFKNSLLLTTGNKAEYAMGYATLYGDMCGGLAPIGDLLKHQVYELARYYNKDTEIIPEQIINRAPTAELRENQKDQDTLPPYDELDFADEKLITECAQPKTEKEKDLYRRMMAAEFKRWQAAPILRVSRHAFGTGRRYPITFKAGVLLHF